MLDFLIGSSSPLSSPSRISSREILVLGWSTKDLSRDCFCSHERSGSESFRALRGRPFGFYSSASAWGSAWGSEITFFGRPRFLTAGSSGGASGGMGSTIFFGLPLGFLGVSVVSFSSFGFGGLPLLLGASSTDAAFISFETFSALSSTLGFGVAKNRLEVRSRRSEWLAIYILN